MDMEVDSSVPKASQLEPEIDELDDDFDSETEDPNVFKVREPLTPPSARMYSTENLHALIHEGIIDLNPSYQRDVVWPENKQIGLIDSIFRNFYIPPIVFAVRMEDGEEVRTCVDGKQRLTSIQKFFDGQIPHKDAKTKKNFWFTTSETAKAVRNEVPDYWKREFSNKQITCVEYQDILPGTEREIFQRVQLGMTLTAAEKLQAISSPWADWISVLEAQHVAVDGGLSDVLEWDTKRGRNFQNLAHLVYCCDGLPQEERLPTAQKIDKWLNRVDPPPQQFKSDMEQVLKDYWVIATDKSVNQGFKRVPARLAPVEFIFIGVLLYVLRKESAADRGRAIYNLRNHVRQEFKDIRNNTNVGKSMWEFISGLRLEPTSSLPFSDTKSRRKRKADQGSDEEYRPEAIRSLGKPAKTRSSKHSKTA